MNFFMLLKKRLKAGVLLYALLMAAVLSLLLNFYTHRLKMAYRIQAAQLASSQSYVLAELAKPMAKETSGEILFDKGKVVYQFREDTLEMTVIADNQEFSYHFLKEAPPLSADKTVEKTKVKAERKVPKASPDMASEPL
ncbi:competence type IV pilus minor pilin ComGG [Streptococcus thoraltensis]|uniref:competence type IV pilus minor pilin ComGG n=1 Tax=Streptococcus thoraltensis TaxID=55085 RepID=UPI0012EAD73E|nr:competence type IV pilus minor pilin ComGG [Streptococcus thoraltensis]MDY4761779.1 competence type IV pilus minor pilin ComGG [Streptococcus thoraltensis]